MRLTSLCPPFSPSPQQAQTEWSGSQHHWNKQDRAWSHISLSTHTHSTTVCRLTETDVQINVQLPDSYSQNNLLFCSTYRTGRNKIARFHNSTEIIVWQWTKQAGWLKYNIFPFFNSSRHFCVISNNWVWNRLSKIFSHLWEWRCLGSRMSRMGVSVCLPLCPCSSTTLLWMECVWPWAQIQQYQMLLLVTAEQWLSAPVTNEQTCISTINTIVISNLPTVFSRCVINRPYWLHRT